MPDWDENSPELESTLQAVLREVRGAAVRRERPTLALAKHWHKEMLRGLTVPKAAMVAGFRGGRGLESCEVRIGAYRGVKAALVAAELTKFEVELQAKVLRLDSEIAPGAIPKFAQVTEILALCAWTHAEWVRIHPFANGNGRTARFWANFLARRYGLPMFVRLRPRPGLGYDQAGAAAMRGNWGPTEKSFRLMLADFLANPF